MPKRGLQTPFQRDHDVQFGLVATERDELTSAVCAATCLFCLKFGREAKPGAKPKRTAHTQVFTVPFRTDTYTWHHNSVHPVKWAEFQQLTVKTKFCEARALCSSRFGVSFQFAGGLASMLPNTATAEADFSLIGYGKDQYRQSLTDCSLEGILDAKQFDTLRDLSTQ